MSLVPRKRARTSSSAAALSRALAPRGFGLPKAKFFRGKPIAQAARQYGGGLRTGGFLGRELKFIDYEVDQGKVVGHDLATTSCMADPATVDCLNAIAQGDGPSDRDGRKAIIKSCHVRGEIHWEAVNQTTPMKQTPVRVMLVLDTQTNGAQCNPGDVLEKPTSLTIAACAYNNLEHVGRFRVLKDIMVKPGDGGGGTSFYINPNYHRGSCVVPFRFDVKWKEGLPVIYSNTTAGVSTITDNSLHVIAFTNLMTGGANGTTAEIRYVSRVRFLA